MAPRVTIKEFIPNPANNHPQEVQALFYLVDLFADEMKIRLMEKYYKGYHGWDHEVFRKKFKRKMGFPESELPKAPVDMANLAMFLWNLRLEDTAKWLATGPEPLGGT